MARGDLVMDACGSLRLGHGTALSPVPLINMMPALLQMYQVHKALRGDETVRQGNCIPD
jgi:hypothetical protein